MKFCLGTAQFGFPYGLNKKYYSNINLKFKRIAEWNKTNLFFDYIDTAFNYGESEKIIGQNIENLQNVKIISKFSYDGKIKYDDLIKNVNQSLDKLKIKNFYGVLVHDKSMFSKDKIKITLDFLSYLEKNKITKKIGISVYNTKELSKNLKYFDFNLIQLPINILNQSFVANNYLENLSIKYEIFGRSVFLQGLLLENIRNLNKYFLKYNDELLKYHRFLIEYNLTPLEACIGFIYSIEANIKIIFGINNLSNLKQIKKTIKSLDKNKLKKIDFSKLKTNRIKLINPTYWKI